jgi:hypothetical protein
MVEQARVFSLVSLSRLYVCHMQNLCIYPDALPTPADYNTIRVLVREPFPRLLVFLIAKKIDRYNHRG